MVVVMTPLWFWEEWEQLKLAHYPAVNRIRWGR
jgi:hypothetical protein